MVWVLDHSPYKGAALTIHHVLGEVENEAHEHELWMTQAYLAARARTTRKTVGEHLARMVEDGFLELVEDGKGRGRANRYRFLFPDVEAVGVPRQVAPVRRDVGGGPTPGGTGGPTSRGTDPEELELELDGEPQPAAGASFDAFWNVYPRHVGKAAARKAWDRAVKRADVETILAGAGRYAAEVSGRDLQHVAHPTTWLNADRWDDEAGANRGSRGGATQQVDQDRTPGVRRLRP